MEGMERAATMVIQNQERDKCTTWQCDQTIDEV